MAPMATGLINHYGSALPVFRIVGIAMLIIVVIAALCLKVPPAGYKPAGWNPPAAATGAGAPKATRDFTYEESKATPQFWLLWVAYFCGSFAGLMCIGLIAKHGIDAMSLKFIADKGLATIKDIPIPGNAILVSITRDTEFIIPHGNTVLLPWDRILCLTQDDTLHLLTDAWGLTGK